MELRCSVGTYQLWLFWVQSGRCSLAGLKPQLAGIWGKALILLLPHQIFLSDTRVAPGPSGLDLTPNPDPNRSKRSREPLEETSALT